MSNRLCPIISAFSEVKDATGYPKCVDDECEWWVEGNSQCAITAIALGVATQTGGVTTIPDMLAQIVNRSTPWDDYQAEQGLRKLFGAEGVQNMDLYSVLSNLRVIIEAVADRLQRGEPILGG